MRLAWIGILILVIAAAFLLLGYATGFVGQVVGSQAASFTALFALLIVLGGSVLAARDMTLSKAIRHSAVWLAFGAVLIVLHAWREEIAAVLTTPLG